MCMCMCIDGRSRVFSSVPVFVHFTYAPGNMSLSPSDIRWSYDTQKRQSLPCMAMSSVVGKDRGMLGAVERRGAEEGSGEGGKMF